MAGKHEKQIEIEEKNLRSSTNDLLWGPAGLDESEGRG
jgi:hypothetical protein